jgi:hypothetical protein
MGEVPIAIGREGGKNSTSKAISLLKKTDSHIKTSNED